MAYPARAPAKNDAPTAAQYHRRTRKCRKRKDEPLCTTLRGYFDGLCRPRLRKEQGAHQEENRREGGVLWGDVAGILSLRAAKQRTCAKPTTHAEPQGKCSARERPGALFGAKIGDSIVGYKRRPNRFDHRLCIDICERCPCARCDHHDATKDTHHGDGERQGERMNAAHLRSEKP